jgi:hypothetical protein
VSQVVHVVNLLYLRAESMMTTSTRSFHSLQRLEGISSLMNEKLYPLLVPNMQGSIFR